MTAAPALKVVEGNGMQRDKALDAALSQIERAFGKGSIMRLGQQDQIVEIESISTGSLGLDIGLGIGGLPRGRIVESTARKFRQDDPGAACRGRSPEGRRRLRLCRCRTRA